MDVGKLARRFIQVGVGDYGLYFVLLAPEVPPALPTPQGLTFEVLERPQDLALAPDPDVARIAVDALPYPDVHAFVARADGAIVAGICVWGAETYLRRSAFLPIGERDAKSMQNTVSRSMRGRGLGSALEGFAHARLLDLGYKRLWGKVWHSNKSSLRMLQRAGWRRVQFVAELVKDPSGPRRQIIVPLGQGFALPSTRTYRIDHP